MLLRSEDNKAVLDLPIFDALQKLENPDLRGALDMRPEQKGVMVRRVEPTAAASQVLSEGDVLTSFDGVPIANDGTVPFRR